MTKGQHAPRTTSFGLRARAWWVMRERASFTLNGLLSVVARGSEADAASNLGKYVRALTRAGVLAVAGRAQPARPTSNGEIRYRLAKNLGAQAPVWRASRGEVYDPNSGAVYAIAEAVDG